MSGRIALVLHTHIPFVLGHGRWPHGSDWLCEAAAECYLPLLDLLADLPPVAEGPWLTIGMTPVLAEQLSSPLFRQEFETYLKERRLAADLDASEFAQRGEAGLLQRARGWVAFYERALDHFQGRWRGDLVRALAALQEAGVIEMAASAATHGYLPLLGSKGAVRAQIEIGIRSHRRCFGRPPTSFWLPECAYRPGRGGEPGLERYLEAGGVRAVFLEPFPLEASSPPHPPFAVGGKTGRPPGGRGPDPHRLWRVGDSGVVAFLRDPATAVQVWSGEHGYPGDGAYLEFHKRRWPGGLRYWRVTGARSELDGKALYDPEQASRSVETHADHFVEMVAGVLRRASTPRPLLTAMFDTELMGHWWFEGPRWLGRVLRGLREAGVVPGVPSRLLDEAPRPGGADFEEGSWGEGGDHRVWRNPRTEWIWKEIRGAEGDLAGLARAAGRTPAAGAERALGQLAREVLLLESSDWPFLVTRGTAGDYAEGRVREHARAARLLAGLARAWLSGERPPPEEERARSLLEERDFLFREMDWRMWGET